MGEQSEGGNGMREWSEGGNGGLRELEWSVKGAE